MSANMIITREQLKRLIRVPFKNGGRDYSGVDCWGLVMLVFGLCGVQVPDYRISCTRYSRINAQIDADRSDWERIETPQAPCLIVMHMDTRRPSDCNHLGVYIGDNRFLHAIKGHGVGVVRLNDQRYATTIEGFYVPGK